MKLLDLFSGITGFSLAFEAVGCETVAFCECNKYRRKIIAQHYKGVPIYEDISGVTKRTLETEGISHVDIVTGGFPCQPFSVAGRQRGKEDDRYLWPEMFRVIKDIRPRWVVIENVVGIVKMALDDMLSDMEGAGYTCQSFIIPACAVGAPQKRERLWIICYSKYNGQPSAKVINSSTKGSYHCTAGAAQTCEPQRPSHEPITVGGTTSRHTKQTVTQTQLWAVEPNVGRVANGVPDRMDRIKALGDAIVYPLMVIIAEAITAVHK